MKIDILKVDKELPTPEYAYEGDAGLDLYSAEEGVLESGQFRLFPTGLKIAVPRGYEAQIRPRSGLAAKHGISIVNAPGTIDHQYRGELNILLINLGKDDYKVERGQRIAQLVFNKIETVELNEVDELDETHRGEGGYGSTGY
ncbi:dUTP diphosphatase [Candidatus Woesearchaeota archaeon]|nr:dUTP diphosphatase [Candidatus Woesearchaeota archaeon]